jgi:hypothetical protein
MLIMNTETIPDYLKQFPQWIVWKAELVDNPDGTPKIKPNGLQKVNKIPFNPIDHHHASSTDPDTWGDFDDALNALDTGLYTGIGFVFTKGCGICGVDIDMCLEKGTQNLNEFAEGLYNTLNSYTEIGPSGDGLHILCIGSLAGKGINRPEIEMYDSGRFFTITGDVFKSPRDIEQREAEINELYSRYERKTAPVKELATGAPIGSDALRLFLEDEYAKALWEKEVPHKSQSEYDLAIASCATHRGFHDADIVSLIAQHREKWGEKPEKANRQVYIEDTLTKAKEGAFTKDMEVFKEAETVPFFVSANEILTNPPKLNWLIKNYLPANGIIWLAGEWSSCKTFMALQEAFHVALGLEWCGNKVEQGQVVYISGEGFLGLGKRVKALEIAMGVEIPQGQLLLTPQPVMINNDAEYRRLVVRLKRETNPALIIIDTKSANMQGSDSDAATMNDWVNRVRVLEQEFQCAVLTVDHVGHQAKGRPRGASQQMGAADCVYMLEREHEMDVISLTVGKDPKDFRTPQQIDFKPKEIPLPAEWDDADGEPVTSLVLQQLGAQDLPQPIQKVNTSRMGKSAQKALKILTWQYSVHQKHHDDGGVENGVLRVSREDWIKACHAKGISRSTMHSIPDNLEARGLIRFEGKFVFLTKDVEREEYVKEEEIA